MLIIDTGVILSVINGILLFLSNDEAHMDSYCPLSLFFFFFIPEHIPVFTKLVCMQINLLWIHFRFGSSKIVPVCDYGDFSKNTELEYEPQTKQL